MYDFTTKKRGQLSRLLFLKIHDKMDIFKDDISTLELMIKDCCNHIDEFQAIEYRLEEINEALDNPLSRYRPFEDNNNNDIINGWLDSETNTTIDTDISNDKPNKKRKYDQGDIRNWLENSNNNDKAFLESDLFDKSVYSKIKTEYIDSELEKAIELSKNDISHHTDDDLELQLALELSKNDILGINESMTIKTIDN